MLFDEVIANASRGGVDNDSGSKPTVEHIVHCVIRNLKSPAGGTTSHP